MDILMRLSEYVRNINNKIVGVSILEDKLEYPENWWILNIGDKKIRVDMEGEFSKEEEIEIEEKLLIFEWDKIEPNKEELKDLVVEFMKKSSEFNSFIESKNASLTSNEVENLIL